MAVRRPTQHDRILGTRRLDAQIFEVFDREHVANKFPHADNGLVDRLGAAISRRRAALRYRQRHHEKLAHGMDNEDPERAPTEFSATIATEFTNDNINVRDDRSDARGSQTSYAPTLYDSADRLTIPVPNDLVFGDPFECPYCYYIVSVNDRNAWAGHVFQDISPYTCPFDRCPTANKLYWRQREWYSHIQCHHADIFGRGTHVLCPLCKEALEASQVKRHLSRHMEELALFAVPRAETSEDETLDFRANLSIDHTRSSKPAHTNLHPKGIETDSSESDTASDVEGIEQDGSLDEKQLREFIDRLKLKRKPRIPGPKCDSSEDQQYDDDDTELLDISRTLAEAKLKSKQAQVERKSEGPARSSPGDRPGENREPKKKPDSDGSEANFPVGGLPDPRTSAAGQGISNPEPKPSNSGRMDYRSLFAEGPRDEMRARLITIACHRCS